MSAIGGRRSFGILRVTAMTLAVAVVVGLAGWAFVHQEAERREAALRRFDARAVTGAGFAQAYVSEIHGRENGPQSFAWPAHGHPLRS